MTPEQLDAITKEANAIVKDYCQAGGLVEPVALNRGQTRAVLAAVQALGMTLGEPERITVTREVTTVRETLQVPTGLGGIFQRLLGGGYEHE